MHHPLVSVIIPVYNRAHLIREALDSVAAQDYPALEIILVDDGSRDADALKQAVDAFAVSFAGTVKLIHQENSGAGAARNHGLQISTGDFIQYLDSDDLLLPGKILAHVEALQADPEAVMVYGVALEELPGGGRQERKLARSYVPDLLEATLQWRRWSTNGALWRYSGIPGWRERAWWGTSRVGQDVVHDVRVGCQARKILFVDAPATLVRIVTNDHTSHSPKPAMVLARYQVLQDVREAIGEANLFHDPRYALRFAERCLHAGMFLARWGHWADAVELLRWARHHYPYRGLQVEALLMAGSTRALRVASLPERYRMGVIKRLFNLHKSIHSANLHVYRGI